jgi:hypothetical protein
VEQRNNVIFENMEKPIYIALYTIPLMGMKYCEEIYHFLDREGHNAHNNVIGLGGALEYATHYSTIDPKGRFTLWTVKLEQGSARQLIGC